MLSLAIAGLSLIGIYVSAYMLRKQTRASRGELTEPSVVTTPRSKVTGIPNSLLGLGFYCTILIFAPFLSNPLVWMSAVVATIVAAAFSVYLAYSLLFITRMPCAYCWAGHAINWLLLTLLVVRR
jgi:uncharacterized membrane protein